MCIYLLFFFPPVNPNPSLPPFTYPPLFYSIHVIFPYTMSPFFPPLPLLHSISSPTSTSTYSSHLCGVERKGENKKQTKKKHPPKRNVGATRLIHRPIRDDNVNNHHYFLNVMLLPARSLCALGRPFAVSVAIL